MVKIAERLPLSLLLPALFVPGVQTFLPRFSPNQKNGQVSTSRLFVASSKSTEGSEILSETAAANTDRFTPSTDDPTFDTDVPYDEEDVECMAGTEESYRCLPVNLVTLPRHSHAGVDAILDKTETILRTMHVGTKEVELSKIRMAKEAGRTHDVVYANNYVDLGKIDT